MREAVENLGCDSKSEKGLEMSHLAKLGNLTHLAEMLLKQGFFKGNFGGGGRSRTADAADMSRVL
jgi:hypothetical protein